ncbi:MAG: hypothetical protein ABW250_11170, partial [Pyrinomonadaceae bacterium]
MKRPSPRLLLLPSLLAALSSLLISAPRVARVEEGRAKGVGEAWLSVRSQNFLVEGEAGERDLRRVAARLEEYRAAVARRLPGAPTGVPTAGRGVPPHPTHPPPHTPPRRRP